MDDPVFLHAPDPALAVIIPVRGNERSIVQMIRLARQFAGNVIVVEDDPRNKTAGMIRQAGATVLNAGEYGGGRLMSLLAGCRYALKCGCTAVVILDSAGRYPCGDIPRLAAPVLSGEADLVIGSRNLWGRKGIPPCRFDAEEPAAPLPEKNAEFHSTDPSSSFRALSTRGILLLDLLPDNDQFDPAMIALFMQRNLVIREIPVAAPRERLLPGTTEVYLPRYRGKKIAVVVPAYNEELLIGETLAGIPDFVARIYVVNDTSTDRTQEVVEYYASHDPAVIPLRHEVNQGVGAAIVTGYKKALEDGMDVMAVMAGDNQMDPAFLPELLDPVIDKKCDYTMGNRLVNPGYRKGMSKWRFSGNAILTLLTKIASGYWQMVDPQNGYTAISRRALERISLDDIYPRYGYCNDVLVKLNVIGFRVINVPHPSRYGLEKSKIKYSTYILKLSRLLLKDFFWRLKMKYVVLNFHPLVFFYLFGALLSILGLFGGIFSLYRKIFEHRELFDPAVLSLLTFGLGVQCIFFAMFFDMQQEKNSNGWYS